MAMAGMAIQWHSFACINMIFPSIITAIQQVALIAVIALNYIVFSMRKKGFTVFKYHQCAETTSSIISVSYKIKLFQCQCQKAGPHIVSFPCLSAPPRPRHVYTGRFVRDELAAIHKKLNSSSKFPRVPNILHY